MNSRRQSRPSGGDSETTASGSSYTSLLRSQLPNGVGDDAPYQPFVLVGNPDRSIVCRTRTQYEDFVQVDAVADIVRSQRRKSRRNAFTDVGQQFDGCRYETVYIEMNIHRA